MTKFSFIKIIFILSVLALFLRLYNIDYRYMPSDAGYELEAARSIVRDKKLPMIGPALSVSSISIPPTYLYWISFFYLLQDNVFFINRAYALIGFLTVLGFTALVYCLTNNKKVSLLFLAVFTVWYYHIGLSSTIWHPHPVFFFLTFSLLFNVLALKRQQLGYLLLGQILYVIALSIYPSPVFLLPIIVLCAYYFWLEDKHQPKLNSVIYSLFSLFICWLTVYLSQIIFDLQHSLTSFYSLITHTVGHGLDFAQLGEHFYKIFVVFAHVFFPFNFDKNFLVGLLFIFVFFILYLSRMAGTKLIYLRVFTNFFSLLWMILMLLSLRNQDIYDEHRTDVFNLLFLIIVAIDVNLLAKLKVSFKKMLLFSPFVVFFGYFFITNLRADIYDGLLYKDPESIYMNQQMATVILTAMDTHKITNDSISVFFLRDSSNNESTFVKDKQQLATDALSSLWFMKWQADRVDYFINKALNKDSQLIDSMQMNLGRANKIDYLKQNHYFLICKIDSNNNPNCLESFLHDLKNLDSQNLYSFASQASFYVYNYYHDNPVVEVYLITKSQHEILY